MGASVYWKNMTRLSAGQAEQSLDDMEVLPYLEFTPSVKADIQIQSRKGTIKINLAPDKRSTVTLDRELWRENPEVIIHYNKENIGTITFGSG